MNLLLLPDSVDGEVDPRVRERRGRRVRAVVILASSVQHDSAVRPARERVLEPAGHRQDERPTPRACQREVVHGRWPHGRVQVSRERSVACVGCVECEVAMEVTGSVETRESCDV